MRIRVGISPCPNDIFIFSGILLGQIKGQGISFDFDFQDVEELNRQARGGEKDLLKISFANWIHCRENYELLQCGGALGRGCGPLLLVNGNGSDNFDKDRKILVPGAHTTANFLLDFFAGKDLRKEYMRFDRLYERLRNSPGEQGVVIHEKRFTYQEHGLTLVEDLGRYWESVTGFPIPLGALVGKKSMAIAPMVEPVIRDSLDWAYGHYREAVELCRSYASDLSETVIESHIRLYVNEFSRVLGQEGNAAVTFFLERQKIFLDAA